MDSENIKQVVARVNEIASSKDYLFVSDVVRNQASSLLVTLTVRFRRSPTLAVAVVQHLIDQGFDLTTLRGEAFTRFSSIFGPKMSKLNTDDISQIRRIAAKLFQVETPQVPAPGPPSSSS